MAWEYIKVPVHLTWQNNGGEGLDEIHFQMRVSTGIKSVLSDVDREFSMCDNYPKGHRDIFYNWIETYHPGALLLHLGR